MFRILLVATVVAFADPRRQFYDYRIVNLINGERFVYQPYQRSLEYDFNVNHYQKPSFRENQIFRSSAPEAFNWERYHTLEEIYAWLDSLAVRYPDKIKVIVGGRSYEGRDIKGVKLSFGANKPGVFIEGGIHAREWIAPATVTYLLNEFLTSDDSEVRNLAEKHDWYMFPSVNPDGYVYTFTTNRLWRKTRSNPNFINPNCTGADANRNWNYQWLNGGASRHSCYATYAGRKPFSEIETKSMADYLLSIKNKLFAYIAFHSYGQLLLFPYGHTKKHLGNYNETYAIALKAVQALSRRYGTQYRTGNLAEVLYTLSGSSIDWVKATLKLPLCYLYELRDKGKHGFILPARQIIPNGEEILDSLVAMFKEAANFGYPKQPNSIL